VIRVEFHTHLTSKTNARAFGFRDRAKTAKAQRVAARTAIEAGMRRNSPGEQPYRDDLVSLKINGKTGLPQAKIKRTLSPFWQGLLDSGLVVTFTRIAGRRLDPKDNLREAFKNYADGVADAFGTHDGVGETRIDWRYADQVIGSPSRMLISIERKEVS
jgi:hypothetical protein